MAGCCAWPYMYAVILALLNIAIVGFVQPKARYYYEQLRFELRTGALGAVDQGWRIHLARLAADDADREEP